MDCRFWRWLRRSVYRRTVRKVGEATLCPMLFFASLHVLWAKRRGSAIRHRTYQQILSGPDFKSVARFAVNQVLALSAWRFLKCAFVRKHQNRRAGFIYNEQGKGCWGLASMVLATTIIASSTVARLVWFFENLVGTISFKAPSSTFLRITISLATCKSQ